ncbi:MAG: hypothetical protein IPO50_00040 [Sphingomonadales bacterium]|nr:hypothetical protein [Sphingomonadales bacterium]
MTLQSSGPISLGNVAVELGRTSTTTTSLGEAAVRTTGRCSIWTDLALQPLREVERELLACDLWLDRGQFPDPGH